VTWLSDRAIERLRDAAAWPELDDRYVITGVAGRGGMGTVYIARDQRLDRDVAVKVLAIADQKGSRAAWLSREAHILARLDHPAIVPVHDTGVLPDGRSFYVMKLVRGRRLDEVLAERSPQALRLDLFARVLEGVSFAHAHGVVHRDLKPENIMAGSFGEVFVMDWGVAQDRGADAEPTVVGTPGFMPPEQAGAREVDARADIFALGAMLVQVIGDKPMPPLAAIAAKAQHPDPQARYQSVEEMAADVSRFRNQEPVSAYRESWVERLLRLYRRYELPILLLLAYVMMRFVLLAMAGI
jgi:serine/threonine protein kinase